MALEDFKPEEAYRKLVAEIYHAVCGGMEVKITPISPTGSPSIYVTVSDFQSPAVVLSTERSVKFLSEMESDTKGFGGTLAEMIKDHRLKIDADRKKARDGKKT